MTTSLHHPKLSQRVNLADSYSELQNVVKIKTTVRWR